MKTLYLYPKKRNGDYGNPIGLQIPESENYLMMIRQLNPTLKMTVVTETTLPFSPEGCSGDCESCVLKDDCSISTY